MKLQTAFCSLVFTLMPAALYAQDASVAMDAVAVGDANDADRAPNDAAEVATAARGPIAPMACFGGQERRRERRTISLLGDVVPLPGSVREGCLDVDEPGRNDTGTAPFIDVRAVDRVMIRFARRAANWSWQEGEIFYPAAVGVSTVEVRVPGQSRVQCDPSASNGNGFECNNEDATLTIRRSVFEGAPTGALVEVSVNYKIDNVAQQTRFYFRVFRRADLYDIQGTRAGFWFPAGLFATNLSTGTGGMPLSAYAIGLAWGGMINFRSNMFTHLGLSIFGSYNIFPGTNGDVVMTSLGAGLLLDIASYAYVGGAYTFDFRTGTSDPGLSLVIGPGPALLRLLSSNASRSGAASQ